MSETTRMSARERQLLRAAKKVMRGLELRIDNAGKNHLELPIFVGIADLFSALRRYQTKESTNV